MDIFLVIVFIHIHLSQRAFSIGRTEALSWVTRQAATFDMPRSPVLGIMSAESCEIDLQSSSTSQRSQRASGFSSKYDHLTSIDLQRTIQVTISRTTNDRSIDQSSSLNSPLPPLLIKESPKLIPPIAILSCSLT